MTFKNILVAFDGSEGSKNALESAIQNTQGKLTVVTVVNDEKDISYPIENNEPINHLNPIVSNGIYQYAIENEEKLKTRQKELLQKRHDEVIDRGKQILFEAKHMIAQQEKSFHTETLSGDPAKAICRYAETHDSDLLVVGHRGLSGIKKLIQGSVSQKIVENASCPVLVVK